MTRDLLLKGIFAKPLVEESPSFNVKVEVQCLPEPATKEAEVQTEPVKGLPELGTLLGPKIHYEGMPHLWFPYYY